MSSIRQRTRKRLGTVISDLASARRTLTTAFSGELDNMRSFIAESPLLILFMAFLTGFIIGGILVTSMAHFVIATLLGGFALAITFGFSFGFPTYLSSLLVVPIHGFAAYAVVKIIYAIERHPRTEPYLTRLRKKYEDGAEFLLNHVGRLGIVGALTLSTFAAGWLPTVVIAYILGVSVSTTVKSTILGLLIGAGVSYATYEGLIKAFPNPMIVTVATLILFGIIGYVIERMGKREHERLQLAKLLKNATVSSVIAVEELCGIAGWGSKV